MWANEWLAEQQAAEQKRFQQLLTGSFVAHLLLLVGLAFAPSAPPPPLPQVLRVNLVAGLPGPPPPRAAAKKLPPAAPLERAAPAPKPVAPKQIVLPKKAPKAVPKKRVVAPPARPEPVEYDDALAQLRNELGEQTPAPARPAEDVSDADLMATAKPSATSTGGAQTVDPQTAKWVIATKRHVRDRWITPPEFLNRGLTTIVAVELSSGGEVLGAPRVIRPSGDPFFDDNAVRAVMASTPLPAPPGAGSWTFSFSED